MIIQQHAQQLNNNRKRSRNSFSIQAGDHHLSLFSNNLDTHSNGAANSRKPSFVHHNQPHLLIDQDVHCNVECAETINFFAKSIEMDLYAEQNETFQVAFKLINSL